MRVFSGARGVIVNGALGLGALILGCGGSDDGPAAAPAPSLIPIDTGEHRRVVRGSDVAGFCAAQSGGVTAFGVVDRGSLRVLVSTSSPLRESTFRSSPELAPIEGSPECQLVATESGFALGWLGARGDELGAWVQRLSLEGAPLDSAVFLGAAGARFALAATGDRVQVARIAPGESALELRLDTVEGAEVATEALDACERLASPVIASDRDGAAVFYTCSDESEAELRVSRLLGDEREVVPLATGEALVPGAPLAVAADDDAWRLSWIDAADAAPSLLTIDRETLEVSTAAMAGSPGLGIWSLELVAHGEGLVLHANSCAESDTGLDCWTEVCPLPLEDGEPESCTRFDASGASRLLGGDGLVLAYLEYSPEFRGDLFTLSLDDDLGSDAPPEPVLGPSAFGVTRLACSGAACTVFGRERTSRLDRRGGERYGFWTLGDVGDAAAATRESIVLEAVIDASFAEISDFDWSVAGIYRTAEEARFGVFSEAGPVFEHSLEALGSAPVLFREDAAGGSRYRLFDVRASDAGEGLFEKVIDEAGPSEARPIAEQPLRVIGRCNAGYVGVADDGTLFRYDPDSDATFTPQGALPEHTPGDGQQLRCLGEHVVRFAYGEAGVRIERVGLSGAAERFDYPELQGQTAAPSIAGPFGSADGELGDGRAVFVLQPFDAAGVVAIALGEQGPPEAFSLALPEAPALAGAVLPRVSPSGELVLVWTDAVTRDTQLSRWFLPPG